MCQASEPMKVPDFQKLLVQLWNQVQHSGMMPQYSISGVFDSTASELLSSWARL